MVDGSAVALSDTSTPGLRDNLLAIQSDIPFSVKANPGMKAMRAALHKYAPSVLTSPSFGETIVFQWVSGQLLAAAVKAAHVKSGEAVTPAEIKTGLYSLHGDTLGGMAPPLSFKKGAAHPVNCWFWMRLKGGVFTTPYGPRCCFGTQPALMRRMWVHGRRSCFHASLQVRIRNAGIRKWLPSPRRRRPRTMA